MISIKHDVVSQALIEFLRPLWDRYNHQAVQKSFYNELDKRLKIQREWAGFDLIADLAYLMYPQGANRFQAFYERQYTPTPLHIDPDHFEYTVIVPIYHDTRIKTLAWNMTFNGVNDWHRWISELNLSGKEKQSNISESGLIDHTFDENKGVYVADYLELAGIFDYVLGSAAGFNSNQIHCSSNWKKLGLEYKDWVAIHYLTESAAKIKN